MDFANRPRTMGAKYGKNKGRAQLQNFYETSPPATTTLPTSRRFPISPSSASADKQDRNAIDKSVHPPSPSPVAAVRPAHVTSHSQSSFSSSHGSRSKSPTKHENMPSRDADMSTFAIMSSTFDMLSSGDELEVEERRPIKKLRLSPIEKEVRQVTSKPSPARANQVEKPRPRVSDKKRSLESLKQHKVATKRNPKSTAVVPSKIPSMPTPIVEPESKPKTAGILHDRPTSKIVEVRKSNINAKQNTRVAPSKSRSKLKPRTPGSSKPQKPHHPSLNDSDEFSAAASPSQLGLSHLRLTAETSPEPSPPLKPATNLRGRKRLIDRLDAATSQPTTRVELAATDFARNLERLHRGDKAENFLTTTEAPKLTRAGSSQTRQTYGRSRNTYAKERSHLSDMVDDLDTMSATGTQDSSQQLLSGLLATGPSQLRSQLDIEESDSSEDVPNFRLKSVYELKQAGTNNRLEKEVEDLMADVNPTGGTKALRIQALMQVMRKTSQDGFAAFLSEYALDRFTTWSSLMKDKVSKLLLGMVFWRLIQYTTAPTRLKQIIQCVVANSSSLPPLDTLSRIAKDRTENLSKSTVRDIVDFEQSIATDGVLPDYEGSVIPAAITLGILNDSMRKIIDSGTLLPLPQSSYAQIVALLRQVSQPAGDQVIKHVFVTKLALSLLQICTGPLEQDLGLSQVEYQALGDSLGDIANRSMSVHEDLIQSILHFTVTLCNDKPHICKAICQSSLITPLMTIIRSRFLEFVDAAQDSQTVEPGMLDSIILTLACLLNLTEHAHDVRRLFATSTIETESTPHLSRLVSIYVDSTRKLGTIKTAEQGSALVMVGYLSLLICNLCLDETLWLSVSNQLGDQHSVSDIVASAKELLIHLRAVETDEGNAGTKGSAEFDGFAMRFGEILSAVRLE